MEIIGVGSFYYKTTGTVGNGSVSKRPTLKIALGDLFLFSETK